MSKKKDNFKHVLDECRASTPNSDALSDEEVLDQFSPEYLHKAATYGSVTCLCGHPIKYVWGVRLKSNRSVLIEPIGSECVKRFVGAAQVNRMVRLFDALWTMLGFLNEHNTCETQYSLNEENVCADNGFNKLSIAFLEAHGLEHEKAYYLRKLLKGRVAHVQFERQRYFSHCTAVSILEILRRELKEV